MLATTISRPSPAWKVSDKLLFRFLFLYFILQIIPFDPKFYQQLAAIRWTEWHYGDIFNLAHYAPHFFSDAPTYADWGVISLAGLAGTAVWTRLDRNRSRHYVNWYYWLRVLLRYRLSIALLTYGFLLLFPIWAPYPSLSNLNTAYGDFTRWKLFSMSLGVAPSYQSFLGLIEVLSGILLLHRKTASIASFITIIFLGNVFVSNIAYDGSEQVYSLHLISIAFFLLMYDGQRIFRLLILQLPTTPNRFKPLLALPWQRYAKVALKAFFGLFFVVLYGFKIGKAYQESAYQFPQTTGLPGIAGLYNVTAFSLNNNRITYSPSDPIRWQDVVFEEWNTISIRSNRPVLPHCNPIEDIYYPGADRTYELEGSTARHYYSYEADTLQHILTLHNRNAHYPGETLVLHYDRPSPSSVILTGTNQYKDSITVILDKIDKKYLLSEATKTGRISGLKL